MPGMPSPVAVPTSVAAFRASLRDRVIGPGYSGWAHFACTSLVSLALIVLAATRLEDVQPLEWLTVPAAFVFANFAEYLVHRGPMHHPMPGLGALYERHSRQHHRFFTHDAMGADTPRDFKLVLFPWWVMLLFFGAIAAPTAALLFWLISANVGLLFAIVGVSYYLIYEWLHFCYHQPAHVWTGRIVLMPTLRRGHTLHHDHTMMRECNFNVTFPIADLVLGTFRRGGRGDVQRQ